MNDPFALVNDALLPLREASVRITDLAIQRGYGVFDFLKTVDNRPVFLEDHLDRLYRSADHMRLPVAQTRDELKSLLGRLIAKNDLPNSGIRITVTGGYSPDGYAIATPNLIVTQQKLALGTALSENGIRLMTHPFRRQFPEAKTLDYSMAIWLQPVIRERGADEVLYQLDGVVSECPRSNFFIVTRDGRLATAARGILKGVIRKQLLDLAPALGLTAEERDVTLDDIKNAAEAFLTSTTKNLLPVSHVDGATIGTGRPGEVTRSLYKALADRIASGA